MIKKIKKKQTQRTDQVGTTKNTFMVSLQPEERCDRPPQ